MAAVPLVRPAPRRAPLTLEVPHHAYWYLVVDGYDDDITVTFRELD
ncbi:hypothetical protein [Saccharothrix obliqua]|nr:hypothetical protein [Saccharothrix obliqua]MBW4722395.1 hypothetical protein [Saccharothrix obliqua]